MKRKLMKFEDFQRFEKDSLSASERELVEAEDVLARALGSGDLKLHCFGESDVTYETLGGSYVHANYRLNESHIIFEGIEELVIDEDTEKKSSKQVLGDFVESLLDNNEGKASALFSQYMGLPVTRRTLKDAALTEAFDVTVSKPSGHGPLFGRKQSRSDVAKRIRSMRKTKRRLGASAGLAGQLRAKKERAEKKLGGSGNKRWRVYARKVQKHKINEWAVLTENVMDYLDYQALGPALKDSFVKSDDKGNVTDVSMPRAHKRNEGKILNFNWDVLNTDLKFSRKGAKNLKEDAQFCRAVADLKRFNAVSDNSALEETLENIVGRWPTVLFLTQEELASTIAQALETVGVRNYDDQQCEFMAEGILRMAHHAYTDRAKKIINHSQITPTVECDNCYEAFKEVTDQFYPSLDESEQIKYRVFSDLYRALHEVYRMVEKEGDEAARAEVSSYLMDCEAVLNKQEEPDLKLAETIAEWLRNIVEANVERSSETWDVSNSAYRTVSGDHPDMAKIAQVGAIPSKYTGDWGSELPVSDGKSYKNRLDDEMRNSWMNYGGSDTYPELRNPYVPKPFGEYKMKEKSAVDDGQDDFSRWQSKDTWPNLENPYVPQELVKTGGTGFKMKNDNLVVDKGYIKPTSKNLGSQADQES